MANDTNQDTDISANPTKELFISMLTRDITLRDAIGDLLDNSVDGALSLRGNDSYEGLWVKIELNAKEGYFRITDNCGGIPVADARDYAFRFGRPEGSEYTPHSVGLFGIGMKRALFKLGNKFRVESVASTSSFTMEVDVEQWKNNNEADWKFQFAEVKENEDNPHNKWRTTITVKKLHDDVKESFELQNEISELIVELQKEHLYNIDNGLDIRVQKKRLKAKPLELLTSKEIKTAYWERSDDRLHAEIYAGVSERDSKNTGWHIFCNDRLVVGPEKMLGWGDVFDSTSIPQYHSQFYRFRGYVFLKAENPSHLPWNTAKSGMEEDSTAYRTIFQQIILLMRSVIDFLNDLHQERKDYNSKKISNKPLEEALDGAELQPLRQIKSEGGVGQKFLAPEPTKKQPDTNTKRIDYEVPSDRYNAVGKHFGLKRGREIGLRTFEYFYNREIED